METKNAMDSILKKLNYKGQKAVCLLNAPETFKPRMEGEGAEPVFSVPEEDKKLEFAMVFAISRQQMNDLAGKVVPKLKEDAVFWICYPKGTSKRYTCDFNRDTGWEVLGKLDMEPVRQVSIDEDWSALRFRKTAFIKKITRSEKMTLSEEGRKRAGKI